MRGEDFSLSRAARRCFVRGWVDTIIGNRNSTASRFKGTKKSLYPFLHIHILFPMRADENELVRLKFEAIENGGPSIFPRKWYKTSAICAA